MAWSKKEFQKRGRTNKQWGVLQMRKVLTAVLVFALMLSSVLAVGVGTGVGVVIEPEQFAPRVFMNPVSRIVLDDYNEPGAITGGEEEMTERIENYAFEGEQISWDVLVWDKNGKEKIEDVYVRLSDSINSIDFIEANCREDSESSSLRNLSGLIYEGEEMIEWNIDTMRWYNCVLTVETPASMHGEFFAAAVATDLNGLSDEFAENELWFLNPVIALGLSGDLNFGVVRPGSVVLSDTLVLTNNAEAGSGVLLDMFIAGTDFYDPSHSGAMCPTSNVLRLTNFEYYASLGAYNTCTHSAGADAQCYVGIPYYVDGAGDTGNNNFQRIVDGTPVAFGVYPAGNVLSPGADMSLNFKLSLPEPCNGGPFSDGEIRFFGEAI
jgi:hypothetical protein